METVAQVLEAAANVTRTETSFEMLDYLVSLAEGIMDAWGGIILALKQGKGKLHFFLTVTPLTNLAESLKRHVEPIFGYLHQVSQSQNRSEALLRATMGVIG